VKQAIKITGLVVLISGLAFGGCAKRGFTSWKYIKNPALAQQLRVFVAEEEAQDNDNTNPMPRKIKRFFNAAKNGNWLVVSIIFVDLQKQPSDRSFWRNLKDYLEQIGDRSSEEYWFHGNPGEAIQEIHGALEAFGEGGEKYSTLFGNEIIQSIPRGSIYIAWSNPGQYIVSVMQNSQAQGDPFFTLSSRQWNLSRWRLMYGDKIYVPTEEDWNRCFDEVGREIEEQAENGKRRQVDYTWRVNELLTKVVFDKNTNREFYVEGSSLAWMCPYLEPHGLILKINRQPMAMLPEAMVQQNDDYWTKTISPMIGGWLNGKTSVAQVAAFAEKVFLQHDYKRFNGDASFVQNINAGRMFSNERIATAELYVWREGHATSAAEKKRMNDEADFGFRQAWALSPGTVNPAFSYVKFLTDENRTSDALLVGRTALKVSEVSSDNDFLVMREMLQQILTPEQFQSLISNADATAARILRDNGSE
jgi:hypothetical protein